MLEDIIKPCPKCGGKAEYHEEANGYVVIICSNVNSPDCCGEFGEMCVMIKGTLSDAIKIWNRRIG